MAHTQVQWGRGNTSQVGAYTGPVGELILNTDNGALYVQDGVTAGGKFALAPVMPIPQGRLTLTSGTPVQTADNAAATTIYYSPYCGRWCPLYNGSLWLPVAFSETSLALDATNTDTGYQASGSLFDVFALLNAGAFTIGTGPAWTSTAARGTGAGTTELQQLNGIWTNKNAITLRFGSATGNTVSVPANQATYLGTMYATANGQTAMVFFPAPALGGNGNVLGLWNAYYRVAVRAQSQDSTASWTYSTVAWRAADGSNSNRITWVDGLAQSFIDAEYEDYWGGSGGIGVDIDSTSAAPNPGTASASSFSIRKEARPLLGLHYAQAMELVTSGTGTFFGSPYQALLLNLEM